MPELAKEQTSYVLSLETAIGKAALHWLNDSVEKIQRSQERIKESLAAAETVAYSLLHFLAEKGSSALAEVDWEGSPFPFLTSRRILQAWEAAKEKKAMLWRNFDLESADLEPEFPWEELNAPSRLVTDLADFLLETAKASLSFSRAFSEVSLNKLLISERQRETFSLNFEKTLSAEVRAPAESQPKQKKPEEEIPCLSSR